MDSAVVGLVGSLVGRHRQALEAGADPAMIAQWTGEVVTERARLELALQQLEPSGQLS